MFSRLKHWKKNDDGITAIEFAIVGVPLILLILSILEITIMFASAAVLQGASVEAARMIRTGQAQNSGDAQKAFEDTLCGLDTAGSLTAGGAAIEAFIDCDRVRYRVIRLDPADDFEDAFADRATIMNPVDGSGNLEPDSWEDSAQNDRVIIRVSYDYPLRSPLAAIFSDRPGNRKLLMTTVIVRNEPYT